MTDIVTTRSPKKIHFSIPAHDEFESPSMTSFSKSRFESLSARSISATTCDAFEDDGISEEEEEYERERSSDDESVNDRIIYKKTSNFGVIPEDSEAPMNVEQMPLKSPADILTRNASSGDFDEEAEASMMEGYLIALVQRNTKLTPTSLLGLRYDLTRLQLSDLTCLLRTLFELVEILKCQNLSEMFLKLAENNVAELLSTNQTSATKPVQDLLIALMEPKADDFNATTPFKK